MYGYDRLAHIRFGKVRFFLPLPSLKGKTMFKSKRIAKKVMKVINSCETIGQLSTAMNMVNNYGKLYNYNNHWSKLDRFTWKTYRSHLDKLDYEKKVRGSK